MMGRGPPRLVRQLTISRPCHYCGTVGQDHPNGLMTECCIQCAPAVVANMPWAWAVPGFPTRQRCQLMDPNTYKLNIKDATHIQMVPPTTNAVRLGKFMYEVSPLSPLD